MMSDEEEGPIGSFSTLATMETDASKVLDTSSVGSPEVAPDAILPTAPSEAENKRVRRVKIEEEDYEPSESEYGQAKSYFREASK